MSKFLKQKPREAFKEKINKTIKLISFQNGKEEILGSAGLKSQLYTSDIDLFNVINYKGTKSEVISQIVNTFKRMVKRISQNPNVFIVDFKAGRDDLLYFKSDNAEQILNFYIKNKKFIDKEQYEKLIASESLPDLKENARKIYTLRWSPKELEQGFKILKGGRKKHLKDVFGDGVIIKMDIIAIVDNKFYDMTNIYEFKINNRKLNPVKMSLFSSLVEDIKDYYHSKDYTKMLKRIFSVSKLKKDIKTVEKLTEILNDNVGLIYKARGDIETLLSLLEKLPKSKLETLRPKITAFIQIIKASLGNVYQFNLRDDIYREFDLISKIKNFNIMRERLEDLKNYLKYVGNTQAEKEIKKLRVPIKKYLKL